MTNLCEQIIARYLPKGVKVKWRKDGKWRPAWTDCDADGRNARMLSPYPDTPFKALVFLHECAHFANNHFTNDMPLHEQEYQAERLAMTWWRNEGQRVPNVYLKSAKQYVRECISRDKRAGKAIKTHIARWARK